jgi:carboxymethylenebutenolidase
MPEFGFDGVVGFYGMPGTGGPLGPGPTQVAGQLRAPILGVFGGADEHIPQDQVQAFVAALTSNGVEHELLVYPNAPHSFFDVKHSEHTEASIQAWTATHRFLNRVLRRQTSQSP